MNLLKKLESNTFKTKKKSVLFKFFLLREDRQQQCHHTANRISSVIGFLICSLDIYSGNRSVSKCYEIF